MFSVSWQNIIGTEISKGRNITGKAKDKEILKQYFNSFSC